jgi:hypothetical protein
MLTAVALLQAKVLAADGQQLPLYVGAGKSRARNPWHTVWCRGLQVVQVRLLVLLLLLLLLMRLIVYRHVALMGVHQVLHSNSSSNSNSNSNSAPGASVR